MILEIRNCKECMKIIRNNKWWKVCVSTIVSLRRNLFTRDKKSVSKPSPENCNQDFFVLISFMGLWK